MVIGPYRTRLSSAGNSATKSAVSGAPRQLTSQPGKRSPQFVSVRGSASITRHFVAMCKVPDRIRYGRQRTGRALGKITCAFASLPLEALARQKALEAMEQP